MNIAKLLTLAKKDPLVKAKVVIQKSLYKSIPKVDTIHVAKPSPKKLVLAPLRASVNKKALPSRNGLPALGSFNTIGRSPDKIDGSEMLSNDERPYESFINPLTHSGKQKQLQKSPIDLAGLKQYRNHFETLKQEGTIDAQRVMGNQRYRSLHSSLQAKRRNINVNAGTLNSSTDHFSERNTAEATVTNTGLTNTGSSKMGHRQRHMIKVGGSKLRIKQEFQKSNESRFPGVATSYVRENNRYF